MRGSKATITAFDAYITMMELRESKAHKVYEVLKKIHEKTVSKYRLRRTPGRMNKNECSNW